MFSGVTLFSPILKEVTAGTPHRSESFSSPSTRQKQGFVPQELRSICFPRTGEEVLGVPPENEAAKEHLTSRLNDIKDLNLGNQK
jgi:hypothetical protein